jgi:hypothetical protein
MGMQIDKSRRHNTAGSIEDTRGSSVADTADFAYAAVLDSDVRPEAGQASTVHDRTATNNEIVFHVVFTSGLSPLKGFE